ncbi:rhodanese-like domain-containing protein [Nocardioides perillae]|uniref:Rhodanese-related sulfurtransferase n=1 Tax=Nocardioides perillae TaxID=1119534 RepID=A0A7Y9USJ9_9ACTN|nr:rhodanese-like domain-containing protein [Nocardioides perillae]NYG55919.1 rhodanese-related sulfurtransferase [Nocardioides perillae]
MPSTRPATRPVRTLLWLALAVLALGPALVGCGSSGADEAPADSAEGPSLDAPDFAERMAEPGTVLLDVRTPEEFAAGHIAGARNLPLAAPDFVEQVRALDPGATYAVYCRTDRRSGEALAVLAEHGLTDAYDLAGGMEAWQAYGGAVVRD